MLEQEKAQKGAAEAQLNTLKVLQEEIVLKLDFCEREKRELEIQHQQLAEKHTDVELEKSIYEIILCCATMLIRTRIDGGIVLAGSRKHGSIG